MSEIERQLLHKMQDPKEVQRIYDMGLRAHAFEDPDCRGAFSWMLEYWENNSMRMSPDDTVMEYEFPGLRIDNADKVSTEWLVSALQQRYMTNQVQEAIRAAGKTLNTDPETTTSALWHALTDISENTVPRTSRSDMSDAEGREARYRARGAAVTGGVPYGITLAGNAPDGTVSIDEHTHGQLPGELAVFAAFTKIGKSFALCKSIAEAHMAGFRPIMFSLEMTIAEMEDRIDAFYSGVSYAQLANGSMMPQHEAQLREARERLADIGPLRIERPARGERTVKYMVNRARQTDSDYILIDQLSWIDSPRTYASDNSGMRMKHGDIVFDLKDEIGRESAGALPCALAVQMNRDSQKNSDGRGALYQLANSSFIEQTVDCAFGLWRNQDMINSNLMGIDLIAGRRSPKKSWMLNWRLGDRTEVSIQREYED